MADPFVGEIRMMANTYAPYGWAYCNGQAIAIQQNTVLFSVIGIAFGGNGTTMFNLPDFRSAAPIGTGQGPGLAQVVIGEFTGEADVTLTSGTIPAHTHTLSGKTMLGDQSIPANNLYLAADGGGGGTENLFYMLPGTTTPDTNLSPNCISSSGSGSSHPNAQPFLTLGFCIALQGEYPARN
ncbi:tail fiber protein [Shewanella sp. DW31]|uniref:phage tail protein n=1 Tax=Shewanella sp. DW31 TaxID=2699422 RepID=UPI0018E38660|nr:tail fiber protein [Shewanella sp. DW31]MBI1675791.1 phage tail protein [Shewanella sp. DW31]